MCAFASFIPRLVVHFRGERRDEARLYGRSYLLMVTGQLLYKVVHQPPAGGGSTSDSLDVR